MMKWLPLPGHDRWRERASAFADGELGARDRERFAAHLGRCAECAAFVDDLRLLKAAVASLPTAEAPRSFRLTPAMVARPAAVSGSRDERRPLVVARRASQFASVAAVVALGVVALTALNLGLSSSDDSGGAATLASRDSAPKAAEAGGAESTGRNASASPAATKALPDFGGNPVGSSGFAETPAAPSPPQALVQDTATNSGGTPGAVAPGDGETATALEYRGLAPNEDSGPGWRLTAAIGLAAVALIAGASVWALRRRDP